MAGDSVLPVATVQAAGRPTTPSPRPKGIGKSARGPPGGSSGGMARSPVMWKAQTIRGVARPEAILLTGANAPMRPSPLAAHPAALLLQAQIVRQQVQDQEQPGAATEAPRPQPSPSPQAPPQRSPSPPQTTSPEPPSASPPAPPQAPPPRPQPAPDPPPVAAPSGGTHQQPRRHHAAASQLPNLPEDFADAKVRIGPLRPPLDPTAKEKRQPEPVPAVVHTMTASLLGDDLKALPGGTATGRIGARLSVKQHLTCKQYSDDHGYTDQLTGERPLCQSCPCARIPVSGVLCTVHIANLSFIVTWCCSWKSFSLCRRRAASPPHPPRAHARACASAAAE